MGYVSTPPAAEAIRKAEQHWDDLGVSADPSGFVVCFFGTFGRQLDLDTVLRAARTLQSSDKPIRFVLCGNGDHLDRVRRAAANLKNAVEGRA
jgi:glycosyltransferase involved in cell wall biosynthesis